MWSTPDVKAFISQIDEREYEGSIREFSELFRLLEHVLDDAYLARSALWGIATGLENQLLYLGGNFRDNLERKLNQLVNPRGVLAEDDLLTHKFSNETHRHVNEDQSIEEQALELKLRIDQVTKKMAVAGIGYVLAVRAHDEISKTLGQMTYGMIKSKAASRKMAASAA